MWFGVVYTSEKNLIHVKSKVKKLEEEILTQWKKDYLSKNPRGNTKENPCPMHVCGSPCEECECYMNTGDEFYCPGCVECLCQPREEYDYETPATGA